MGNPAPRRQAANHSSAKQQRAASAPRQATKEGLKRLKKNGASSEFMRLARRGLSD
jgi:hypothetical protein